MGKIKTTQHTLFEVVERHYDDAVSRGLCERDVTLRSGKVVPEVILHDPETRSRTRIVRTPWAFSATVGVNPNGEVLRLPVSEGVTIQQEPLKLVIERGQTLLARKSSLIRLGRLAREKLTEVIDRSSPASYAHERTIIGYTPLDVLRTTPDGEAAPTIESRLADIVGRAYQNLTHIYFKEPPDEDAAAAGYKMAQAHIAIPDQNCAGEVEAMMLPATGEVVGDTGMFILAFDRPQDWSTLDGTIVTDTLSAIVEGGSDVLVENVATDAGFSHLATTSLVRVQELLASAELIPFQLPEA